MKQTDQELLQAISEGNTKALSEFYDRHSQLIYGATLRILGNTDDAEDIMQDAFIQVLRKASTYKPELGSPKNWLVRIAHNRALNLIRAKRVRGKSMAITDDEISVTASPSLVDDSLIAGTISSERLEIVGAALKELPKDQAYLIDLAFFQGYSHSEVTELTGIPLGTVKTKIRKGLQALRSSLDYMKKEFSTSESD
jgi:RNA polymerase sigma-70 factor (ECF subfamily)